MRKHTVLSICLAFVFCVSFASSAIASDEDDVMKVADSFVTAMNTNDGELFNSMFDLEKATAFGPLKSVGFLFQGKTLENHFASFSSLPEGAISFTAHNQQVVMLDSNSAIVTSYGIMTFSPPIVKESTTFQIRETMVVQKVDGKWKLVHEHSSLIPTE